MSGESEDAARRLQERMQRIDREAGAGPEGRKAFFDAVYETAEGDAAAVPWADLKPKDRLAAWLAQNPGEGLRAIDIACGLGDNAEAIAAAGYRVTAFDLSQKAVAWANRRFPVSPVNYVAANLLDPPAGWRGGFDLVHECYTIQSMPPDMHEDFARAVAALAAPGGTLLVYARTRGENSAPEGPPWALTPSERAIFGRLGFELAHEEEFELVRRDRTIPHAFAVWRRSAE